LECSEVDYEISLWYFKFETMFWKWEACSSYVLVGYIDSDMAEDIDFRRSSSNYLITFRSKAIA